MQRLNPVAKLISAFVNHIMELAAACTFMHVFKLSKVNRILSSTALRNKPRIKPKQVGKRRVDSASPEDEVTTKGLSTTISVVK